MKRIVVTLVVVGLSTGLFAQDTDVDNAGIFYLRSLDLLAYPTTKEVKDKLQETIKSGWEKDIPELDAILTQNIFCFNEFEKAVSLQKCDFYFGKKYKYLIEKEPLPAVNIKNLSDMVLLRGRQYEKQGDIDKALGIWLSLITFSSHISQDNALISKLIALQIEDKAYGPIRNCLSGGKVGKELCQNLLSYLEEFEKKHFPAKELILVEKESFLSTLEMLADGIKERSKEAVNFKDEFLKEGKILADKYYGFLITAAETNQDNDWYIAQSEIQNFKKEVSNVNKFEVSFQYLKDMIRMPDYRNKTIASKIAKLTLVIALPDFVKAVERYYLISQEFKDIKALTTFKLSQLQ